MRQIKKYYSYNRIIRSLIKLPIVLVISLIYVALLSKGNYPLFLYFALVFTALYLLFTINLKKSIDKIIAKGGDFHSCLAFYPLRGGIIRFLLLLVLLFLSAELLWDYSSWQKSFDLALHMWMSITLFSIMHDVESWLIYKYGQLQRE